MMIRRRKDEVLTDLPPKHRNTVLIEGNVHKELAESLTKLRNSKSNLEDFWDDRRKRDLLITSCYRETCKSKLDSVKAYIETFIECCDDKIIIFAHHHVMLDAIQVQVEAMNLQHIRIDGSVPPGARFQLVDEFQTDEKCRIAIISITAGGTGVTLNAASKVIFAELYWTPSLLLQAEDRAHRIGQQNHVSVYYLIAQNTFDQVLWSIIRKKINVVSRSLDGEVREFDATATESFPNEEEELESLSSELLKEL